MQRPQVRGAQIEGDRVSPLARLKGAQPAGEPSATPPPGPVPASRHALLLGRELIVRREELAGAAASASSSPHWADGASNHSLPAAQCFTQSAKPGSEVVKPNSEPNGIAPTSVMCHMCPR